DGGLAAGRNDVARDFPGLALPDRKGAAQPEPRQIRVAPRAHFVEKQITKSDRIYPIAAISEHDVLHDRFVNVIRASSSAPRGQIDLAKRNANSFGLFIEKRFPHAVVTDAAIFFGHAREERNDLVLAASKQLL